MYYFFEDGDMDAAVQRINSDLHNFSVVATDHALIINPNKSKAIVFGKTFDARARHEITDSTYLIANQ